MSVPFSNTHLRVPRGFGTILEGLAREVLRDQPEDIPEYAAQYFDTLLKQREDSGMDPAEWAAKLEDRFYNNHSFKATGASPETEPETEVVISKDKSYESQTEDESSHSANLSSTQPNVSEEVTLTESTEEKENHDITEKPIISMEKGLLEEESVNRLPAADVQPDELSGTEEENDPTITAFDQVERAANEEDSSSVLDQDMPQSELESTYFLSFRGATNIDVCAQELGIAEDERGDKLETAVVDSEGEEKTEFEEPVEVFPYSRLADVDVCATELGGTVRKMEGAIAENDTHVAEEESSKPQPEETVVQSSLSQSEPPEGNQQEEEDQVDKTNKEEGTETGAFSGGIDESLAHIEVGLDSNAIPKEDSLVEISFEDVQEAQQIKEVGEKQPEEEDSVEALQTKILEMQQERESKVVTAMATHQNISGSQDHDEAEMVGGGQEVNSEGGEMESQHEASDILKEKVDTNDSYLNDSDEEEKGEGVKNISSSHQPTTEADDEKPEGEADHENEDNEKISEGEFNQNESNNPDFEEDETKDAVRGDKEDIHTEDYSEVEDKEMNDGMENHSLKVTQSNTSEENKESQRTRVESQPEDTVAGKKVTSKERTSEAEELVEEGNIESEMQENSDAMCGEGNITPIRSQGEERPPGSEKDSTEPEGNSGHKQEECSRPQEEEDIMDIPLDDPEANRAAAKIQAGFRGHMTRKKMKPEDKAEGEEVSSTGDVLNGSQGDTETGGSGPVERDDTSVPEQ